MLLDASVGGRVHSNSNDNDVVDGDDDHNNDANTQQPTLWSDAFLAERRGILTAILNEDDDHNNNDDGHKDDDDTENNDDDDDDVVGCLSCRGRRVKQRLFVTTG